MLISSLWGSGRIYSRVPTRNVIHENITDVSIQVAYDLPVPFVMSFTRAEGVLLFFFLVFG